MVGWIKSEGFLYYLGYKDSFFKKQRFASGIHRNLV